MNSASNTTNIDWDNKPKLRYKWLSFLFVLLGSAILYYTYSIGMNFYYLLEQQDNNSIDMRSVANDLVNLKVAPLQSLEINQKKLDLLYNIALGEVEIQYLSTDDKQNLKSQSDNLGNFYGVEIVYFGDMYEQLYFLSKLDLLRGFLLVDSINANVNNTIVKARVYGQ